ncbi:MAG TPA: hypothetical protein VFX70_04170 [Mycobacteriales bacterium]|nr:hypothetical protein [Mycobacteriales bacterium]
MRYRYMVRVTEDPKEGPYDYGPMSEEDARELAATFTAEGATAELRDVVAEATAKYPVGTTMRDPGTGLTGVVTPGRAVACPADMAPGFDMDTRITVAVDSEHGLIVHLRGEVNGWAVAECYEVVSA